MLTGWGYTQFPGIAFSTNLIKLNSTVMDNDECREKQGYPIYDSQICLHEPNGRGSCQVNSNGVWYSSCITYLSKIDPTSIELNCLGGQWRSFGLQ